MRCDRNWFLAGRIIHLTYCSPFNLQILCLQKALEHIKQNIKQGDLISGELVGIKAVKSALIVLFCTSTPVFLEISSITIEGKSSRDKKFLAFVLAVHNIHCDFYRSDEGLTLETSAFLPFTVANLRFQLSR